MLAWPDRSAPLFAASPGCNELWYMAATVVEAK